MSGIKISASAILMLGKKLTIYIPENTVCPFHLTKPVDIILMREKDVGRNTRQLEYLVSEDTKILYY